MPTRRTREHRESLLRSLGRSRWLDCDDDVGASQCRLPACRGRCARARRLAPGWWATSCGGSPLSVAAYFRRQQRQRAQQYRHVPTADRSQA